MCSRTQKLTVVLASASPRRTELLEQGNIKHVVMPSHCEEVITSQVPSQVVEELSVQKAEDVYQQYETKNTGDFLVIGSDTVVAADGTILGKPKDKEQAYQMISMLQGKAHQVYTGVTLLIKKDGKKIRKTFHECSDVHVYPMSKEEIREYIATGEPMDKAGAYGIQGAFGVYICGIEGDYNTIVGLPLARVYQEMKKYIYGHFWARSEKLLSFHRSGSLPDRLSFLILLLLLFPIFPASAQTPFL